MMRKSKHFLCLCFGLFSLFCLGSLRPSPAHADVPKLLNYQGRLTDENDVLYDSTVVYMKFDIFDASSGGNELWSSDKDNGGGSETCGVTVVPENGVFNLIVGDNSLSYMADLDIDFDTSDYYLEIKIQEGSQCPVAEGNYETLSPRQRIVSSGFSMGARLLSGDNDEYIKSPSDDIIGFFGLGGTDNTDLYLDLDGTYPWLYSNTDSKVGIDDDLEFVGAQSISTSTGDLTLGPAGNLVINTTGGTIDIDDGTIDFSTQTVDITLNSAVDALNFDSNTLSIDAASNYVGIGTTSPDNLFSLNKVSGDVILDFDLNDADKWVVGLDDSDGDYFKINSGNTLDDTSDFELQDDGDLLIGGDFSVGIASASDDDYLYFDDGSTEYLAWFNGPGEFATSDDLNVHGNLSIDGYQNFGVIAQPGSSTGRVYYDSTDNTLYLYNGATWEDLAGGGASLWTDGGTYLYPVSQESVRVYDSGSTDYIDITHDGTNVNITTANTGEINIDNNVDIGLNLKIGSSASNNDDLLYFDDGSSEYIYWDDSGNAMISDGAGFVISDDVEIQGNLSKNGTLYINAAGAGSEIVFQTSGTDKLKIENDGDLNDGHLTSGIPLSETNVAALSSDFTATSIVGALNENKSGGGIKYLPVIYEGNAVDEDTFFNGFTPDNNIVVTEITISARTAPTGANLQIDVLKNSAEQSTVATLTAGSNYEETDITDVSITSSDTLGLKIKQVGSTVTGEDITVIVHYRETSGGGGSGYLNIFYEGTAQDEDTFFEGHFFDGPVTITEIDIAARTAPTGANLEIDVLEDGVEQLGTNAQLTAGSTFENTNISDLSFDTADRLGLIIKQIGSTVAGESFNVILHYTEDQGDVGRQYLVFPNIGLAEDENDYLDGFYFDSPTTISQIGLFARTGPSGSALTVDLLKTGSEESRTTTLRNGGTYQLTNVIDDSLSSSNRVGLRIKSIGSTTAGASILTVIHLGQGPSRKAALASGISLDGRLIIGTGDFNSLSGFSFNQDDLYVSGDIGVSGTAYLEGGTAWTSADIAERYPTLDKGLTAGDLVSIDPEVSGYAKKSEGEYDGGLLGVVSTDPAGVLGYQTKDSVPVALIGRVPVKVSNVNGPIKTGDMITGSRIPGVGMTACNREDSEGGVFACQAGMIVGRALEPFDGSWGEECEDGSWLDPEEGGRSASLGEVQCGQIKVFMSVGWHDPTVLIAENGELWYRGGEPVTWLSDRKGGESVKAWLEGRLASLTGPVSSTKNLVAGRVVTPLLEGIRTETREVKTEVISPLADGKLVIRLDQGGVSGEDGFRGLLEIQDGQGEPVVAIDDQGNIEASGSGTFRKLTAYESITGRAIESESLAVKEATVYGDLVVGESDAGGSRLTVYGRVAAEEITAYEIIRARKIVAEGIQALGESQFGELVAEKVTAGRLEIVDQEHLRELLVQVLGEGAAGPDNQEVEELIARLSAQSDELETEIIALQDDTWARLDKIESERAIFRESLEVLGSTQLLGAKVSESLLQGGKLLFSGGEKIDVLGGTLRLQSKGLGAIDFIAGAMRLDEQGNLIVSGQLTVAEGLFTDKIGPVSGKKLTLEGDLEATGSARFADLVEAPRASFGDLLAKTISSKKITAESISAVDLVATDSARIKDLILEGKIQISTQGPGRSAGVEKILAGARAAVVNTTWVEENSRIFLTPQAPIGQPLYLDQRVPGAYFVVGIQEALDKDLEFAWLLLNEAE